MAWKGRPKVTIDPDKLRSILVNSGFQTENPALFQTINQMIDSNGQVQEILDNKISKEDKIDLTKQVEGRLPIASGGTITNIYVPDITLVANVAGAGVDPTTYFRIGNLVQVSGKIQVSPIAVGVATQVGISFPLASYPLLDYHCAGVAICPTVAGECAAIYADVVNFRAQMEWISGFVGPQNFFYNFTYRIIQQ